MKSFYKSYIKAFINFAQNLLEKQTIFKTLSAYALVISDKANELIKRAAINSIVDLPKLRKEMFEIGAVYIHKFSDRYMRKNHH